MLFEELSADQMRKKAWNIKTKNRPPSPHLLDTLMTNCASLHDLAQNLALKRFFSVNPDTSLQLVGRETSTPHTPSLIFCAILPFYACINVIIHFINLILAVLDFCGDAVINVLGEKSFRISHTPLDIFSAIEHHFIPI